MTIQSLTSMVRPRQIIYRHLSASTNTVENNKRQSVFQVNSKYNGRECIPGIFPLGKTSDMK